MSKGALLRRKKCFCIPELITQSTADILRNPTTGPSRLGHCRGNSLSTGKNIWGKSKPTYFFLLLILYKQDTSN